MLTLAAAILTTPVFCATLTCEDILKIEAGMSMAEVEARLGKPFLAYSWRLSAYYQGDTVLLYEDTAAPWPSVTYSTPSPTDSGTWRVLEVSSWGLCSHDVFNKAVQEGKIKTGASREQVRAALGVAYRHVKIGQNLGSEEWALADVCYLHFDKGVLTSWQAGKRHPTVNKGISEEKVREQLKRKLSQAHTNYISKYPDGYLLLGVVDGRLVCEPRLVNIEVGVDWSRASFQLDEETQRAGVRLLPLVYDHKITLRHFHFNWVLTSFRFVEGEIQNGSFEGMFYEVIDTSKPLLLIGFK